MNYHGMPIPDWAVVLTCVVIAFAVRAAMIE